MQEIEMLAENLKKGDRLFWSEDLAKLIRSPQDALIVFRQIPIQLIESYGFDNGFYLDEEAEGWYAISSFWEICGWWDLDDKSFIKKAKAIAGDYGAAIDSMENYLNQFPSNEALVYWYAFKKAFLSRESNARAAKSLKV